MIHSRHEIKILVALISCITTFATGQDFRPGFIVKANKDSVTGFVANRSSKNNSRSCLFRKTMTGQTEKYQPADLRSYGMTGFKYYETKTSAAEGRKELVFMELLVRGEASLLASNGFFFVEKDSLVFLPKPTESVVTSGDVPYKHIDNKYRNILKMMLSGCNIAVDRVSYTEYSLIRVVEAYNRCRGGRNIGLKEKIPKYRTSWSFLSGIDQASTALVSENFYIGVQDPASFGGVYDIVMNTSKYSVQQVLSIPVGFGVEFSAPRKNDKWYLSLELWYDKKTYQGHFEASHAGSTVQSDLTANLSYLKMPVGLRVNLKEDGNTPYLKAGFTHYFVLNLSAQTPYEIYYNGTVTTTSFSPILSDSPNLKKKNSNGFWIGGGYSRKLSDRLKGFLEARFEINTGFSDPSAYSHSSGSALNILAGIKF